MRPAVFAALLLLPAFHAFAQATPEPAQGLRIPNGSRPWALDQVNAKPELVPLHSSAVQTNNHRGGNVVGGLFAGPLYKARFTTELDGPSAKTAIHSSSPVFYLHIDSDPDGTAQTLQIGWAIVYVVADKNHRLLSTVKFTQFTGTAKRNDAQIDVSTETLPDGWLRIVPKLPLAPGEYALEPVFKQESAFSALVYDFRIAPDAPSDPDVITR